MNGNNISMEDFFCRTFHGADLLEYFPVATALVDRAGKILALNHMMAVLGRSQKQYMTGRYVEEFSKIGMDNINHDFKVFDEGDEVPDHDLHLDGRLFHVYVKPVKGKDEHIIAIIICLSSPRSQININDYLTLEEIELLLRKYD